MQLLRAEAARLVARPTVEESLTVRGWDAMYVALAEVPGAVLVTPHRRLAAASGPTCPIEAIAPR
jgi:predicted nucleic acid-binding protein